MRAVRPVGGNTTRVLASDLQALSSFMKSKFNYDTGGYQDYPFETPARRYLIRGDYNLNSTNKISVRYNQLDSDTDVNCCRTPRRSASATAGANTTGLNFEASNYQIMENIRSVIGEWNGAFGGNKSNTLIVGYTDAGREPQRPVPDAVPVRRHPRRRVGVHVVRLRALHAEQRAALQHVPVAGQLHDLQAGPHLHLRRELREVPVRERVLPGQAERLRLQLAGGLLHRRQRLPREPEPDDVAGDAPDVPGTLEQHPRRREAAAAARGAVHRRLRPGRLAGEEQLLADLRPPVRRAGVRRHRLRERRRRRHDVHGRERRYGAVLDRETAGPEVPVVASRGFQLGRVRQPEHAGPRRHGHLHWQAGLRLDLQPDRQYGRADGVRVDLATPQRGRSTRIPNGTSRRP